MKRRRMLVRVITGMVAIGVAWVTSEARVGSAASAGTERALGSKSEPDAEFPDAEFIVLNTCEFGRSEYLGVSIPFNKGQVPAGKDLNALVIEGKPTAWRPLMHYDDGSVMMAQAQAKFDLAPNSKAKFKISAGTAVTGKMKANQNALNMELIWVDNDGKRHATSAAVVEVLEHTAFRHVTKYRGVIRQGDKEALGLTVWKYATKDADWGHFDILFGLDSMENPLPLVELKSATLRFDNLEVHPMWGHKYGDIQGVTVDGNDTVITLERDFRMLDNECRAYRAVWGKPGDKKLKMLADNPLYPLATPATFKAREQAIGVCGYVPPLLHGATEQDAWSHVDNTWRAEYERTAGPTDHLGYTCMKSPGATGDQADFGVLRMFRTYQSGHPGLLQDIMPAMFREALRMNNFYGLKASDYADTDVYFWTEKSNERMGNGGKIGRGQKHWDTVYANRGEMWMGYDLQHYSLNYKYEAWTLTGNWYLYHQMEQHYQHIALGWIYGPFENMGTANRALGRTLHAAMLAQRVVGDPSLMQKIIEIKLPFTLETMKKNREKFESSAIGVWENASDGRIPKLNQGTEWPKNDVVCNWQEGLMLWSLALVPDKASQETAFEAGRELCLKGYDMKTGKVKDYYLVHDPSKYFSSGYFNGWVYPSMRMAATQAVRRNHPDAKAMVAAADAVGKSIFGSNNDGPFCTGYRFGAIPPRH